MTVVPSRTNKRNRADNAYVPSRAMTEKKATADDPRPRPKKKKVENTLQIKTDLDQRGHLEYVQKQIQAKRQAGRRKHEESVVLLKRRSKTFVQPGKE